MNAGAAQPPSWRGPPPHLQMLQHRPLLGEQEGTVGALEHAHPLVEQVLVKVRGEQRLVGEDRITHGTFVDHSEEHRDRGGAGGERGQPRKNRGTAGWDPSAPGAEPGQAERPGLLLGLLVAKARVLGVDVRVGAGGRLECHGADGAFVEHFAVRRLDVGLDGVHTPEHDGAARAPEGRAGQGGAAGEGSPVPASLPRGDLPLLPHARGFGASAQGPSEDGAGEEDAAPELLLLPWQGGAVIKARGGESHRPALHLPPSDDTAKEGQTACRRGVCAGRA